MPIKTNQLVNMKGQTILILAIIAGLLLLLLPDATEARRTKKTKKTKKTKTACPDENGDGGDGNGLTTEGLLQLIQDFLTILRELIIGILDAITLCVSPGEDCEMGFSAACLGCVLGNFPDIPDFAAIFNP